MNLTLGKYIKSYDNSKSVDVYLFGEDDSSSFNFAFIFYESTFVNV